MQGPVSAQSSHGDMIGLGVVYLLPYWIETQALVKNADGRQASDHATAGLYATIRRDLIDIPFCRPNRCHD